MDEKPLINASKEHHGKTWLPEYRPKAAILAFLPLDGILERFTDESTREVPMTYYWQTWARNDGNVLAGPIFGGPLCSVIIEELAAAGVEHFIGFGASGALRQDILPGSIMVAGSGFCSDGTSREYTDDEEAYADEHLLKLAVEITGNYQDSTDVGKVWTTDAIYREFPSKIKYWQQKGARYVNLETGSFYSVARCKGLKAVYLSAVSDCLSGDNWSGWYEEFDTSIRNVWDICLEIVERLKTL